MSLLESWNAWHEDRRLKVKLKIAINKRKDVSMKTGKRCALALTAVLSISAFLFVAGCSGLSMGQRTEVPLCTQCGQFKGTSECCAADATLCDMCGLAAGSPGCCKIVKGADSAAVCTGCGQIKGSDACCVAGAETCSKCGLVKGSPGCCRLPKVSFDTPRHAY